MGELSELWFPETPQVWCEEPAVPGYAPDLWMTDGSVICDTDGGEIQLRRAIGFRLVDIMS